MYEFWSVWNERFSKQPVCVKDCHDHIFTYILMHVFQTGLDAGYERLENFLHLEFATGIKAMLIDEEHLTWPQRVEYNQIWNAAARQLSPPPLLPLSQP